MTLFQTGQNFLVASHKELNLALEYCIYIHDIMEIRQEGSELYVYAYGSKLFNHINSVEDANNLQTDLDYMDRWIKDWFKTEHNKLSGCILWEKSKYHTEKLFHWP